MTTAEDRTRYHGYLTAPVEGTPKYLLPPHHIAVEVAELTGRATVLRMLECPEPDMMFGWGYGHRDSNSHNSADALLTDALGMEVQWWSSDGGKNALAVEFCEDVVANLPEEGEWYLDRIAVLWWVRGWYIASRRFDDMPERARTLAPTVCSMKDTDYLGY